MKIDSIRVSDASASAPAREDASARRSDFEGVFDSILGTQSGADRRAETVRGRDERRDGRSSEPGTERSGARKARSQADSKRAAEATRESAEDGARRTVSADAAHASGDPVAREVDSKRDENEDAQIDERAAEQLAETAVDAGLRDDATSMTRGIPEWLDFAHGEATAASEDLESAGEAEVVESDLLARSASGAVANGRWSPSTAAPGIEPSLATPRTLPIADESARAAARAAAEAVEAAARTSSTSADLGAEGAEAVVATDRVIRAESERMVGSTAGPLREDRSAMQSLGESARPPESLAGMPATGSESTFDQGSEEEGANARPRIVLSPPPAREVERGEGETAVPAAASAGAPTNTASLDPALAARLDASASAAAMRGMEAPAPLETTTRVLPAAGPDALTFQAEWLASRGGGTARIVLHPPELGEIAIRVTVRQQAVDVVMVAQTAVAHSLADDQSERLAQAFANRDLRLEQFEVRRSDPSDASSTGQFASSDAGARERERAQEEQSEGWRAAGRSGVPRGGEDAAPQVVPSPIAKSSRPAGVDLRI